MSPKEIIKEALKTSDDDTKGLLLYSLKDIPREEFDKESIDLVFEFFYYDNTAVREIAAEVLKYVGSDYVVKKAIELIMEEKLYVRNAAYDLLLELKRVDIEGLRKLFSDADPTIRKFAVDLIIGTECGRDECEEIVMKALEDSNQNVRLAAAEAVLKLFPGKEKTLIDAFSNEDAWGKIMFVTTLSTLKKVDVLREYMKRLIEKREYEILEIAIKVMENEAFTKEDLEQLIKVVESEDVEAKVRVSILDKVLEVMNDRGVYLPIKQRILKKFFADLKIDNLIRYLDGVGRLGKFIEKIVERSKEIKDVRVAAYLATHFRCENWITRRDWKSCKIAVAVMAYKGCWDYVLGGIRDLASLYVSEDGLGEVFDVIIERIPPKLLNRTLIEIVFQYGNLNQKVALMGKFDEEVLQKFDALIASKLEEEDDFTFKEMMLRLPTDKLALLATLLEELSYTKKIILVESAVVLPRYKRMEIVEDFWLVLELRPPLLKLAFDFPIYKLKTLVQDVVNSFDIEQVYDLVVDVVLANAYYTENFDEWYEVLFRPIEYYISRKEVTDRVIKVFLERGDEKYSEVVRKFILEIQSDNALKGVIMLLLNLHVGEYFEEVKKVFLSFKGARSVDTELEELFEVYSEFCRKGDESND